MILNENTIKSFWNLTPEQENRMMQKTRDNIIMQKGITVGLAEGETKEKITIARNMINMNMGKEIIKNATGLSKEEIEKLYLEK